MVARLREADGRQVYRPLLVRVLLVVVAAFGVWWDVDLVLRGRPGTALLALLWMVAGLALLAALFWRPAVLVDGDAVELRNVLRDVRVPWAALEGVETRFALTLVAGGRRHQSWAATSSGRPPRRRPSDLPSAAAEDVARTGAASTHLRTPSGATAAMVEDRWRAWQESEQVRARMAARPDAAARERPGPDAAPPERPGPDAAGDGAVTVTWRLHLLALAAATAAVAAVLTPVLS